MTDHPFASLPDRGKEPGSKRMLDTWIAHAVTPTICAVCGTPAWICSPPATPKQSNSS